MFFPYFFPNDLMVIFLKYNSDCCWKTSAFRKSMWPQEVKLWQPRVRTTQLACARSNLMLVSILAIQSQQRENLGLLNSRGTGTELITLCFIFSFSCSLRKWKLNAARGLFHKSTSGEKILFITFLGACLAKCSD